MVSRRGLLIGLTTPAVGGARARIWTSWRYHEWARVACLHGPTLLVLVGGDLARLTERERLLLADVARLLDGLETPAPPARGAVN